MQSFHFIWFFSPFLSFSCLPPFFCFLFFFFFLSFLSFFLLFELLQSDFSLKARRCSDQCVWLGHVDGVAWAVHSVQVSLRKCQTTRALRGLSAFILEVFLANSFFSCSFVVNIVVALLMVLCANSICMSSSFMINLMF
jgi:hypothetical protein